MLGDVDDAQTTRRDEATAFAWVHARGQRLGIHSKTVHAAVSFVKLQESPRLVNKQNVAGFSLCSV